MTYLKCFAIASTMMFWEGKHLGGIILGGCCKTILLVFGVVCNKHGSQDGDPLIMIMEFQMGLVLLGYC